MKLNKNYFIIFLSLTLLYLFFQVKPGTSLTGNIYSGDDNCYYGYVSSLVNDFDYDFSNNEIETYFGISKVTGRIVVKHPIGISILLLPFYALAKPFVLLGSLFTHSPFNQRHILFFMFMCAGIILYAYLG